MYTLVFAAIGVLALVTVTRAYCLSRNYQEARKLDVPIVICWSSFEDILWALLSPTLKPVLKKFGFFPNNIDISTFWWTWIDRNAIHEKFGPVFVQVSPFRTILVVSDIEASRTLLSDWRTWLKDPMVYSMFNVFGENVNSVNGHDWQRHRKVTSYVFKEANCKMVWRSALEQTASMCHKWDSLSAVDPARGVTLADLRDDCRTLALHVLAYAAFGKTYAFEHGLDIPEPAHRMSYAAALEGVLHCVGPALLLVSSLFAKVPSAILPRWIGDLKLAIAEFQSYMTEAVDAERKAVLGEGKSVATATRHANDTLLSLLVRANEAEKQATDKDEEKFVLSDRELYGNLFMFNAAGHETTAGTLGYTVPLLAIHQDAQAWCQEEVDAVLCNGQDVTYEDAWSRLVRLRAVMYETVRFFSPVPIFPKWSGTEPKTLAVRGKQYNIPPDTFVAVNGNAVHWDPEVWGKDVASFSPARWIKQQGEPGEEQFGGPPEGAEVFLWSFGPRVCPGRKFSQVEFVGALAGLLKDRKVIPAKRPDESPESARQRLNSVLFDSEHRLSMMVRQPEKAGFVCVAR